MLVESLIRLGKVLAGGGGEPAEVLRQLSDAEDKGRDFYRRVYVVEVEHKGDGIRVSAHPVAQWGDARKDGRRETFQVDRWKVVAAPVAVPTRGNPSKPQGRYPVAAYYFFKSQHREFSEELPSVTGFLRGRMEKTEGGLNYGLEDLEEIAKVWRERLREDEPGKGMVILTETGEERPYLLAAFPASNNVARSGLVPDRWIVPRLDRILENFWWAKAEEGAKHGKGQDGQCSFCGAQGEVVSLYAKAWPFFTTTWTAPLPQELAEDRLVEGVALCPACYGNLTFGGKFFEASSRRLPRRLVQEIFSPEGSAAGKEMARRGGNVPPLSGCALALPVLDGFLQDEEDRHGFLNGLMKIRNKESEGSVTHLEDITGFEFSLPEEMGEDVYRLHLIYYTRSNADIQLHATIEDVLPSVVRKVVQKVLAPVKDEATALEIPCNLPWLLVRAYGKGRLWGAMEAVLRRRSLERDSFLRNVVSRMNEAAKELGKKWWLLREEARFYALFSLFQKLYEEKILEEGGNGKVRSWRELQTMLGGPAEGITCQDVEELGFAAGHLCREFSSQYYAVTKKDFLQTRVMVFGGKLKPEDIRDRGLAGMEEYALKLRFQPKKELRQRIGLILAEYIRLEDQVRTKANGFLAGFWAGYSLYDLMEEKQKEAEASGGE